MELGINVAIIIVILFVLLASGLWIGVSLAVTGIVAVILFTHYDPGRALATVAWSINRSYAITCLPLFIFMGELLYRSAISEQIFSALAPWLACIPGRLLHCNIVGCTIFAAICGSSAATTATIGKISVTELKKRGYDISIVTGSLAGAGTLGIMIPPSIPMILYGTLTGVSVGDLFMAGIIPGLLIAGLFSSYIAIRALTHSSIAPTEEEYSWRDRFLSLPKILPTSVIIIAVLGGIYSGVVTPTEAASVGVAASLLLLISSRRLTGKVLKDSLSGTLSTTCMIMLIVTGAVYLTSAVEYIGIPTMISEAVIGSLVSPLAVMILLAFFYLILGCFFDGASMLVMTLPVVFPTVTGLGFDPIWFGIFLIIMIEEAQITPPVGFNLFVIQNLSNRKIGEIVKSTIPFFLLLLIAVVIIYVWPQVATWLPSMMIRR
jgi:tripartite ATP-independent transporter DctM subunit